MPAKSPFCPRCGRPMSGANLYVSPQGLRRCKHCRLAFKAAYRARERAKAMAAGRARFALLVAGMRAELAAMPGHHRALYYQAPGRAVLSAERDAWPWARRRVGEAEAGELTGLRAGGHASTFGQLLRQARRSHRSGTSGPATMPLPDGHGRWGIWELALWRAAVWPNYAAGNAGRWPAETATDEELLAVIRAAVREHGRGVSFGQFREALLNAGLHVGPGRLWHLVRDSGVLAVQPGVPGGAEPAALESLRWDGLVTTAQLCEAFEVGRAAVLGAVKGGRLTPAEVDGRRGRLFDPQRVSARRDGRPGPVDAGHPLALDPVQDGS